MIKSILSFIGGIAVIAVAYLAINFGGMMGKASNLHPDAIGHYMDMFEQVLETGNARKKQVMIMH